MLIYQVLLCDADFNRPSVIIQSEARFASLLESIKVDPDSPSKSPNSAADPFGNSDVVMCEVKPEGIESEPISRSPNSIFKRLMMQQAAAFDDIKSVYNLQVFLTPLRSR